MKAVIVHKNWLIYREWIIENSLENDLESISVNDLIKYVEEQIPKEDFIRILEFCDEAY